MKPNSSDLLLLSKFKLYLDEHLKNEVLPNGLNIIDVIADYLRLFHAHVCSELLKGFAGNYDQSKFRYVKKKKKEHYIHLLYHAHFLLLLSSV